MATEAELKAVIRVVADTRGAETTRQALRSVQDEARRAQTGIGGGFGLSTSEGLIRTAAAFTGIGLGLNVAAGAAANFHDQIAKGIQAAIEGVETINKLDVVFGKSAESVKALGVNAPAALGTTGNAALAAAGSFGNLFTAMGLTQQQASVMSTRMVTLAADLASFHNIRPEDALLKLQSGLVGEAEPLRVLGVAINEAQVGAKALALGLGTSADTLSESAKVQARYALILEATKTAQGDFARTSDSLANRQRVAAATTAELGQKIGAGFTPAVSESTDATIELSRALGVVLPASAQLAAGAVLAFIRPYADKLAEINRLSAEIEKRGAAPNRALAAEPGLRDDAIRQVGLAFDDLGRAVDASTGVLLTNEQAMERTRQAAESVATGIDKIRTAVTLLNGADVGFLDQKLGKGALAGAALEEALRRAAIATAEINAENRGPVIHPVEALRTKLADQLAQLEDQRSQASRQNVDLALREADARLRLLPIQQELADLQREINAGQNRGLQLTREEAVLKAQQRANPANDALEDIQTQERRLQLIIATTKGAERSAARRELRGLTRSRAEQRAELGALDANAPLVAAQRAARDTALTTQIANIPNLIKQAKLEVNAQPLESALEKVRAQIETDTAERNKVTLGLGKSIDNLTDSVKALDSILTGKPTGIYVPGQDRNQNGGFVDLGGNYQPQAPQAGTGSYRLEVVLNTDGIKQTVFNDILQGEGNARMPTAPVTGAR